MTEAAAVKCFVLVFLVWQNQAPHPIPGVFPNKFDCDVAKGELATMLEKDPSIVSWSIPTDCVAVPFTKKT